MATSIKLILKNKPLSDGTCKVFLQVIKDGKVKLISTGISCLKKDWDKKESKLKKSHPNSQKRNFILSKATNKALKIIDDFTSDEVDFTLDEFSDTFTGEKVNSEETVYSFFQKRIDLMLTSGRTGNARTYKDARNSFFKFHTNKNLRFKQLTVGVLEDYEAHLRGRNCIDSGIAFKMRTIRAVYNSAIRNGIVRKEYYPFEKYKISKLKGKSIKRALTRREIKMILDVDLSQRPDLIDAKNYFAFSYFTRGMNWIDMMKLKNENIKGDTISYIRSKTKGIFIVKILPPVQDVLDYYSGQQKDTDYVFPILLKKNLTPLQIENRNKKTLSKFNKHLKELALLAEVDKKVTSYVIRHSYATNMKQLGTSVDLISQSMGHSSQEVTKSYLKDFEDTVIDDAHERLLDFTESVTK